jgi:hypothetical protein
MIPVQLLLPPLQRIGISGRLQPTVQLVLNDPGIFQQLHDFGPDDCIELVLANGRVFADCPLEVTIRVRTNAYAAGPRPSIVPSVPSLSWPESDVR